MFFFKWNFLFEILLRNATYLCDRSSKFKLGAEVRNLNREGNQESRDFQFVFLYPHTLLTFWITGLEWYPNDTTESSAVRRSEDWELYASSDISIAVITIILGRINSNYNPPPPPSAPSLPDTCLLESLITLCWYLFLLFILWTNFLKVK